MSLSIETKRLKLMPINESHSSALHHFWSDPAVTQFMTIDPFETIEQTTEMIAFLVKKMTEGEASRYTIQLKNTEEIIGTCGLNYLDYQNNRTEVAYDLGSAYWGKGYAFEALSAFVEWVVLEQNFHRLEAKIDPDNFSSIKLIEKLGFKKEGLLRDYEKIGLHYYDVFMYSKIKEPENASQ